MLIFLVPIRHPADCRNPEDQFRALEQLFASMQAQTDPNWRAAVVANSEQRLPPLPDGVEVIHVDFPPNSTLKQAQDKNAFYQAIRLDKGRRLRKALTVAGPDDHVMVTDDDDLLSKNLVAHVQAHSQGKGLYIDRGYSWETGSQELRELEPFHRECW